MALGSHLIHFHVHSPTQTLWLVQLMQVDPLSQTGQKIVIIHVCSYESSLVVAGGWYEKITQLLLS